MSSTLQTSRRHGVPEIYCSGGLAALQAPPGALPQRRSMFRSLASPMRTRGLKVGCTPILKVGCTQSRTQSRMYANRRYVNISTVPVDEQKCPRVAPSPGPASKMPRLAVAGSHGGAGRVRPAIPRHQRFHCVEERLAESAADNAGSCPVMQPEGHAGSHWVMQGHDGSHRVTPGHAGSHGTALWRSRSRRGEEPEIARRARW